MDRLTPLAASFLEAEDVDDAASLAIGSFAIFAGVMVPLSGFVLTRGLIMNKPSRKARKIGTVIATPVAILAAALLIWQSSGPANRQF